MNKKALNPVEQYYVDNGLDLETLRHEEQDIWAEALEAEVEGKEGHNGTD